jgi:hypothetical protein
MSTITLIGTRVGSVIGMKGANFIVKTKLNPSDYSGELTEEVVPATDWSVTVGKSVISETYTLERVFKTGVNIFAILIVPGDKLTWKGWIPQTDGKDTWLYNKELKKSIWTFEELFQNENTITQEPNTTTPQQQQQENEPSLPQQENEPSLPQQENEPSLPQQENETSLPAVPSEVTNIMLFIQFCEYAKNYIQGKSRHGDVDVDNFFTAKELKFFHPEVLEAILAEVRQAKKEIYINFWKEYNAQNIDLYKQTSIDTILQQVKTIFQQVNDRYHEKKTEDKCFVKLFDITWECSTYNENFCNWNNKTIETIIDEVEVDPQVELQKFGEARKKHIKMLIQNHKYLSSWDFIHDEIENIKLDIEELKEINAKKKKKDEYIKWKNQEVKAYEDKEKQRAKEMEIRRKQVQSSYFEWYKSWKKTQVAEAGSNGGNRLGGRRSHVTRHLRFNKNNQRDTRRRRRRRIHRKKTLKK